jgi:long-subunit fatty acid transport protein
VCDVDLTPVRRSAAAAALTVWALLTAQAALAQNPQALFPPNVILPNNNSLPIGEVGGLEGNAYTARASDPTSLWFNPAGIAGANVSAVSASTGTFRILTVSPQNLEGSGGSIDQLPAAVGFVLKKPFNWEPWTFGFAIVRTAAWSQFTNGVVSTPDPRQSVTLSADTSFNRTSVALTLGHDGGRDWRFGGGLLLDILNLRSVQSLTFRQETETYVRTFLDSYRAVGSQVNLRLGLGTQVDLSKHVRLGAVLRTPGVRILPGGSFNIDVVDQRGAVSDQLAFFDSTNITFKYVLPLEAAVGAAWVSDIGEIELDLKGQTGHSVYDGFSSTRPVVRISDPGDGTPARQTSTPFPGIPFASRSIVSVALGGVLNLSKDGRWKLHAGYANDPSPVAAADGFFDRISLNSVTLGVGGASKHISGSLGFNYQFGSSEQRLVADLAGTELTRTKVKISNIGILYSVSYVF